MTFTYPLIGNYGINRDDFESITPVMRRSGCKRISKTSIKFPYVINHLNDYLESKDIPGIEGIDTRKLTRIIRTKGAVRAILQKQTQK